MTITQEGVSLGAHSIVGRDAYWDHFDDNLPEIGIVAVWVSIRNQRAGKIDLGDSKWSLKTATQKYRALDSSKLMDIYYDKRNVRLRSENADRKARRNLNNIILKPGSIGPDLRRDGFLFFRLKREADRQWSRDSVLEAKGVRLEDGSKIDLTLSLSNGNP
jgi:hypothetical protein